MRYLSVCSGIEAATVAWHPIGWQPVAFAEIDKFPSAVLAHHYPTVPNWGDLTRFREWPDATIDLLVGGTPCQSFSVAGLRKGLDDPRGSLLFSYLAVAERYRPRWLVWENVPGVLSIDEGRAFGALLGGLGQLGYGFAYRVLDAQYFGLAQRRARVFVVGYLGDWRRAAAVLLERESLSGYPPPSREAGERTAHRTPIGFTERGGFGVSHHDDGCFGTLDTGQNEPLIAHSLRADGFDASEDGTGHGTPLVMTLAIRGRGDSSDLECRTDGTANAILTPNGGRGGINVGAVAFAENQRGELVTSDTMGALKVGGGKPGQGYPAVAFALGSHAGAADGDQTNRSHAKGGPVGSGISEELAYSLRGGRTQSIGAAMQVRRLTPRECEKLQGFSTCISRLQARVWFDHDGTSIVRAALCYRNALTNALLADAGANAVSVPDVDLTFWNDQASQDAIASVHVRMSHAAKVERISSRGKCHWFARSAALRSSYPLHTPPDHFAHGAARLLLEVVPEAIVGKAALRLSTNGSTTPENGNWPVVTFGPENAVTASDAASRLGEAMKCITGKVGPDILNSGSTGATWLCSVLTAMTSFIPERTRAESFCDVVLDVESDYTLIHYRGKPAADGPRYKALGNSMAVPCMRWIGERIALVERILEESAA